MELYTRIIELIDANIIYCLGPIILSLILTELLFKDRFETHKVLNIIRWVIISYTVVYFIGMLVMAIFNERTLFERASGPFALAYWIMFFLSIALPITLLHNKAASKYWYVLLVALGMKSGVYFERVVIIITSFHRDFLTENEMPEYTNSMILAIGLTFLQSIIITTLALGTLELSKRKHSNS